MKKIKNLKIKLIYCLLLGFFLILGTPLLMKTYEFQMNNNNYPINISANHINYDITTGIPYTWINASSGTQLLLGDDDHTSTMLPFNFTFYDGLFNEIHVTTEGYITFSFKKVITNPTMPSSHKHQQNIIAPYWTNLDGPSGKIYVKNFSSYWVAAWENFNHDNSSFAGSFEIILYNTGDIVFNYDILENVSNYVCGVNYGDGNNYSSYNDLTSGINDFSIKFSLTIDGGNGATGGLSSNDRNTIIIVSVTVGVASVVGGFTLYFYKKNPERFRAGLSKGKVRVKEGASKMKKKLTKLKEKVSKDKNGITTESQKEE